MNLPIELAAATTLGYSIHIGIVYFFWFIVMEGMTPKGRANLPITFYIILSAQKDVSPPF